ncbi:MAG: hypothetical protein RSF79_28415 [Janthinobacterium sp.]
MQDNLPAYTGKTGRPHLASVTTARADSRFGFPGIDNNIAAPAADGTTVQGRVKK